MTISVSATESALLTADTDGDGVADPGDTLTFTVTIQNTSNGGEILTGVQFAQVLDGVTLVPGSINVSPLANNDAFTAVGNTLLEVGNATAQTGPQSSFAGNLFSNDTEFLGDTFTLSSFDATSANGGQVSVNADGTFTYLSAAGFTGADTFTYTVSDGDGLTSTATVTITVADQVWYVDSNYAGANGASDGTSLRPFTTVTAAGTASSVNDYVYVQGNAGGSITLEAGQQLIGTGVALVVGGNTLAGAGANSSIASTSAGFAVTIDNNGGSKTIAGIDIVNTVGGGINSGGTVFGTLTVDDVAIDAAGAALSMTTGTFAGAGFNSVDSDGGTVNVFLQSIAGNINLGTGTLSGSTSSAVHIMDGAGSFDFNGTINHTGNNYAVTVTGKTGGTVDFDGLVSGSSASDGVFLNNNTGATISFDGGVALNTSASNSIGFQVTGGGTVNVTGGANTITSGANSALIMTNSTVGANGITFNSISTSGATNGVVLDNVNQAAGSTGIDINGGSIVNAVLRGVDINATSADVSFAATIATGAGGRSVEVTNSGSAAVGGNAIVFSGAIDDNGLGINLDNNDANNDATITFSGALDIDTATNQHGFTASNGGNVNVTGQMDVTAGSGAMGVFLNANTGSTISFASGGTGLDIVTSNGVGFNAVGGGTVTVTGSANTISSVGSHALNINNTTIGAADVTFQSISANGGTHGIRLNTTGSSGGLHITGTGSTDGSGGTIQNTDTRGIELIGTADVIINNVNLTNANDATNGTSLDLDISAANGAIFMNGVTGASFDNINITGTTLDNGITGLNVSNFTLNNSLITNAGNAANESGIEFSNLSGTSSIANTTISFSETNSLDIVNTDVNLNLTLNNVSFSDTQRVSSGGIANTNGEGGLQFRSFSSAAGTPTTNIDVIDSDFDRLRTQGIQVIGEDDSVVSVDIVNNNIRSDFGEADTAISIGSGIDINGNDTADVFFNVTGNTIQSRGGSAVNITSFLDSDVEGRVNNNTLSVAGIGSTLRFIAQETSNMIVEARNNTATLLAGNTSSFNIEAQARFQSARLDITLDNNTINSASNTQIADISILAGSSASGETNQVFANIINNDTNNVASFSLRFRESDLDGTSSPQIFVQGLVEAGTPDQDGEATWAAGGNTPTASGNEVSISSTASGTATDMQSGTVLVPDNPTPIFATELPPPPPAELPVEAPTDMPDPDGSASAGPQGDLAPSGAPAPGPIVVDDGVISTAELALIVEAAIARWADAGASAEQIAAMQATTVTVSDLGALQLGASSLGTIVIDDNAAGWNWFIDATPGEDGEYAGTGTQFAALEANGQAGTRIDLLTVIMHELGHQIGLADEYGADATADLMFGSIDAGERRLPGAGEAAGATPPTDSGTQYIGAPIVIGTLNPGQSLTIQWQATVDAQTNGLIANPTNSGTVSWTGPSAGSQPTNSVVTVVDTLTLGNLVFLDANGNGAFDAGDSGVDGVALTLFADTGATAGSLDGGDTQIATTTTAGGGLYSFAGLAPGDYIVQVDAANFGGGGALAGVVTTTGSADPDDDVDNDDNGANGAGGIVVSSAITLTYGGETTADGTGQLDINNTLDFGFIDLNEPPVNTVPGTQTINEDATLTFTGGAAISVNDPDVGAGNLTVTLSVLNGQLTLSGTAGLAFGVGDGTDDTTMTFTGTQAAINAALAGMVYETTLDWNGSDTLTLVTNDNGNTGTDPGTTGGASDEQDSDTVTINVTPVADIAADSPTVNEDSGANNLDLLANDSFENPGRAITAVGAASHGTTSINDNGTPGDATDDFVVYTPNANFNGSDSFTYTVTSGGVTEQATATVAITAINDAPVVVGDGTEDAATIVEDAPSATGETVFALFSGQYSDAADAQFGVGNPTGSSPGSFSGIAVVANGSSGATGQWQYFDTGTSTWVDVGAVAANNALLIGSGTSIRFNPAPNFNGTAPTLTAHLIDNSLGFGITFGQHADISGVGATGGTTAYSTGTVVLSQEVTPDANIDGTAGNDTLTGTPGNDYFDVSQGGDDDVDALDGMDRIYYGAALTAADSNDGGAGNRDVVILQGNYALTLGAASLVGIEYVSLQSGTITRWGDTANNLYDYAITTVEANAAPGQLLSINGQSLQVGEDFTFDGSAETDGGQFLLYGGRGVDTFTGGAGNDLFYFEQPRFNGGDTVDGGGGMDAVIISMGSGLNAITFGDQFTNIEAISVNNRYASDPAQMPSYALVLHEGNVDAGLTLIVNGSSLEATQTLSVDGSAETDGMFEFYGGDDADVFIGGANADLIYAAGGSDTSTGGSGADTFQYRATGDSITGNEDSILDFEVGVDTIDLAWIDAISGTVGDDAFTFIGAAAFSGTAGELRLVDQGGGDWLVEGDIDGNGSGEFRLLVTATTADPITSTDFLL